MEYASFRDLRDSTLRWGKPSNIAREFQLSDGQQVYASLRWTGTTDREACGTTADGRWMLDVAGARHLVDLEGHLKPRIVVRAAESETPQEVPLGYADLISLGGVGSFRWSFSSPLVGVVQERFGVRPATPPPPQAPRGGTATGMFMTESGEPLVTVRALEAPSSKGRELSEAEVTISPEALALPDLSLMVLLSWYGMRNGNV